MEKAYGRLFEIEKEMNGLAEKMADAGDNLEAVLKRYGELQAELEASGFYQIGTKIEDAAQGLGLAEIGLDQDVTALSGGALYKVSRLPNCRLKSLMYCCWMSRPTIWMPLTLSG